jgi:hypothetical protein
MIYYYLIMSQKDMLKGEALEEILRERTTFYISKLRLPDFWISTSPKFLEKYNDIIKKSTFYNQNIDSIKSKNLEHDDYCVFITSNKDFFEWIKLRLGYFENIDSDLKITKIRSNGIYGKINKITRKDLFYN